MFSSRHACPVCGYSVPTLEPKLFSFNSPSGACPTCDGLGVKEFFDPAARGHQPGPVARRRRDPRLGSAQRLLLPAHPVARASLQVRHRDAMERAARESAERGALRQRRRGTSSSATPKARAARRRKKHKFEGIVPNLERRYRETESSTVREELREVSRHAAVPGVQRRAPEPRRALRVRRGAQPARGCASHRGPRARVLPLAEPRRLARRSRDQDREGRGRAPALSRRRRSRLPHARSQRRVAVGRRSAAHPAREPGGLGAHGRHVHPR